MSSNTFWTLFFLLIIIIICELMTLSVRFSPLVMTSLHGYDSSDEMEQVKERLTELEAKIEKIYDRQSATIYSKEISYQKMKYDKSNDTYDLDKSLLIQILQRS